MCTIYVKKDDIVISIQECDVPFAFEFINQMLDDLTDKFNHYSFVVNRFANIFAVVEFEGRYDDDVERCLRFFSGYFTACDIKLVFDDDDV